jgi:heptosyltransferase II
MRILIELPTWLGDSVMATPAIENLVDYTSDSKITLIGSLVAIEILKNHPKVIKTYVIDKAYINLYKTIKDFSEFDLFISFRGSFRSKFINFFISAGLFYQFDKNRYKQLHQVEKYNNFINDSINIDSKPKKLLLYGDRSEKNNKTKLLGINPGASYGSSKQWYPEEFAAVAKELSENYNIIIFGGLSEVSIAFDIEKILIREGIVNYENLAGKTSITDLISRISILDLFITGDTGPMHIAASLDIPTVCLFGPTNHRETSQYNFSKSVIVKKNLNCQPCMKRKCPLNHHNCMKSIKAIDVINSLIELDLKK